MYKYLEVINFTDPEVINYFMELQKEDIDAALLYLSQWDYGENDIEKFLIRQQIFDGLLYVKYLENNGSLITILDVLKNIYLALWQIGIEGITLYRKVTCKST